MKYLYEILVPTMMRVNEVPQTETFVATVDKPIRTRYHRVWDEKIRNISGGLTILPPAKGQWVSPRGELFKERMIPVRIICTDEEIQKISDMTAKYYKQEAIFFYKLSEAVTIVHYNKDFERTEGLS